MHIKSRVAALRTRAVGVVLALVCSLVAALVLETGHPAEAAQYGGLTPAASAHHQHGGGAAPDAPWHVAHCGSHCAGHAVAQPPVPEAAAPPPTTEQWTPAAVGSLTSRTPPVEFRPPRV